MRSPERSYEATYCPASSVSTRSHARGGGERRAPSGRRLGLQGAHVRTQDAEAGGGRGGEEDEDGDALGVHDITRCNERANGSWWIRARTSRSCDRGSSCTRGPSR